MTADEVTKPVEVKPVPSPDAKTGDLDIPEYLQKLLESIASREGFADGYTIICRSGSNVGDGFMGVMLSVLISGTRNGNDNEELMLICKTPPVGERKKSAIALFQTEIETYDKFLPEFVKFQQEKEISKNDGFFSFAKCYGTYSDEEKLEFAIVLEDLRPQGFRMWNKYTTIDYQHVKLAFSELGKLHAVSFALRQQRPDAFSQITSLEPGVFKMLTVSPRADKYMQINYDRAIAALHPDDKDEIGKITHLRDNYPANFQASVSATDAEPFTVFCHGDFWNNNMMFQYASADSLQPQRVVLLDWQLVQYCSPATDLSYYLYSTTEQSLRNAHFDDLLHDYHDNLADLLQRLGGNPGNQFSFDDLHQQLNTFGIYGLSMAPILIQVVTVKADDLPNMDDKKEGEDFDFMEKGSPDGFNVRLGDAVRDFVARGYFGEKHLAIKKAAEN